MMLAPVARTASLPDWQGAEYPRPAADDDPGCLVQEDSHDIAGHRRPAEPIGADEVPHDDRPAAESPGDLDAGGTVRPR